MGVSRYKEFSLAQHAQHVKPVKSRKRTARRPIVFMGVLYSLNKNAPQLAEVPKLTEGMNGLSRRASRA